MKRLTKAQWSVAKVHNPHGLCSLGGGRVFIWYRPLGDGRCGDVPGWMVSGIGFKVDPTAHWMDYGSKWFRRHDLDGAKLWASEKFDIKEWVRDPFGAWQDAEVFARATEKARAAVLAALKGASDGK